MELAEEVKNTETAGEITRTPAPEEEDSSPTEADLDRGTNKAGGVENG